MVSIVVVGLFVVVVVLNVIFMVKFLGILCNVIEKISKIVCFKWVGNFFVLCCGLKCIWGSVLFVIYKNILFKLNLIFIIS